MRVLLSILTCCWALGACADDGDVAPGADATVADGTAADGTAADGTADGIADDVGAADTGIPLPDAGADQATPDVGPVDQAVVDTTPDVGPVCDPEKIPPCIEQLIATMQAAPVTNPPSSVALYLYEGACVYYVPPVCCDQYSTLYDDQCQVICAPDGGLTGQGDGKCPGFHSAATKLKVVWQDPRPYP